MIDFPAWTPDSVKQILIGIDSHPLTTGLRRDVLERLLADSRMGDVYRLLLRRNRKTGGFFYPAQRLPKSRSLEEAQLAAIREVLLVVLSAAGDRIAVSKVEDIEAAKLRWEAGASLLRGLAQDFELAVAHGTFGLGGPEARKLILEETLVARRFAERLEYFASHMRRSDDPLVVTRDSGDPIVRGVQTMIAVELDKLFGDAFHGTAATLTSVALGVETTPRTSRSALSSKKGLQASDCSTS
jgi:hypothetical protein